MKRRALRRRGAALLLLCLPGCSSIGPATVPRDRVDYIGAVSESWKEQTLLNVVRLRYGDAPTFFDVSSVISSYAFQGQVLAAGGAGPISSETFATFGANATYIDKPTISYAPLSGDKFTKSLLRPIPPSAIFQLIQAGYPADAVLMMTARAINGVYNRYSLGGNPRDADPEFYPLLDALRRLQMSESVSLRTEKEGADDVTTLIISRNELSPEVRRDIEFVVKTLNLKPGKNNELTITFGALPKNNAEIAILSRSMLEILLEVSIGIDVPDQDIALGRTGQPGRRADAENPRDRPFVRIHSSAAQPPDAYAAVRYRGEWYWIDDRDYLSKRVFTFLMLFFSLAETGVVPQAPLLTIPAS